MKILDHTPNPTVEDAVESDASEEDSGLRDFKFSQQENQVSGL